MIGNDVVDLVLAQKESNWKRKGFLNKLFTTFEQELIQKAPNKDEMVWMLWSIKESVYKAYQRINYNEGFYPTKIKILEIKHNNDSTIELFGITFFAKTTIQDHLIQTIAVLNHSDLSKIHSHNTLIYFKNEKRLPFQRFTNKPISKSHHGNSQFFVVLD